MLEVTEITALTLRAQRLGISLHTVQVSVSGETVAAAVCPPSGLDRAQRMYSVGKTLTGIAVGMLEAEEKLGLDDPICRHFPEMAPFHPWLEATTIRHVLAMRGPHPGTTYRRTEGGWLESYFRAAPTHPPGTVFTYDTSGSYVLSALVERLGGGSIVGYLRPRLLDPLGVSGEFRVLPGPEGIEQGGSGLICTPRDLLRIARHLVRDGGPDDARPLDGSATAGRTLTVPAAYWHAATRKQADTADLTWGGTLQEGYGYQVWLPERGGWLMFGLGGQIVYGDPARELAVVVTANTLACDAGDHRLLDDVMDLLVAPVARQLPAAEDAALPAGRTPAAAPPAAPPGASGPSRDLPRTSPGHVTGLGGREPARYVVASGPGPAELLVAVDDDGARLRTSGHGGEELGWDLDLRFGQAVETTVAGQPAVATAGRPDAGTLDIRCDLAGDDLFAWHIRLAWTDGGALAVRSRALGEGAPDEWSFHAGYRPAAR